MKHLILGMATSMALCSAALADPVVGIWKTQPGDTGGYLHVQIAPCGSAICGTINTVFEKGGAISSDYEHLGKQMIWGMMADGGGAYSGGKIWAPDSDKTYKSKMALNGNTLEVKGCVAGGMICRGQNWTRIK